MEEVRKERKEGGKRNGREETMEGPKKKGVNLTREDSTRVNVMVNITIFCHDQCIIQHCGFPNILPGSQLRAFWAQEVESVRKPFELSQFLNKYDLICDQIFLTVLKIYFLFFSLCLFIR